MTLQIDRDELCPFHCRCQEAADEVTKLRAALLRFGAAASFFPLEVSDDYLVVGGKHPITVADLRAAQRIVEQELPR